MLKLENDMMPRREVLTVRDIAMLFQVDKETVYNWRRKGLLNMYKVGGKWYANREDVEMLVRGV